MSTQDQQQALAAAPDPPQDDPAPPAGPPALRLSRRPSKTSNTYMVIAALAAQGGDERLAFVEVGWYHAHGETQARRAAIRDAENGHLPELAEWLRETRGAVIRAVPARSWPKVGATRYERPPARLMLG